MEGCGNSVLGEQERREGRQERERLGGTIGGTLRGADLHGILCHATELHDVRMEELSHDQGFLEELDSLFC